MMRNLLLVLAEFELDRVRDNWRAAISNAILERGIQPTVAPFGYRKDAHKRFVVDDREAPFVKTIFARRIAGQTWASIARWLNEEDVKPRQSARWTGETVKQLTRREVYVGVVAKGDIRNENAHEPLVSKADFMLAREVFAKDNGGGPGNETPPRAQRDHPLRWVLATDERSRLQAERPAASHPVPVPGTPHRR